MIKYNNSNINDWYFDASDLIKVYRNNAVCYYKITTSGGTSGQTPCYAVVDDISQYQDTEFEDVFNKADGKWYKLNNLSQYEEYGVYGSGRNITYYQGKLTIDSESTLPSGYTEVEYITSEHLSINLNTGTYINTNYYPTDKTRVVIDYQATSSTAEHRRLFGAGHCCQNNIAYVLNMEQNYTASNREFTYMCGSGNTWVHTNIPFDLERHVADFNNDGAIYIDNTQIGTRQNAPFTATYPMYLLTDNNDGTVGLDQYIVGRVYSCQMYEDGTKIRDFVPAQRDSDSKYGLYDIVNDVFYPSSSNYSFSGGSAVQTVTYEYVYSGSSWVNVGEVSGSTASLPNVDFMLNYNARDYDSSTYSISKTEGQLKDVDAVCNYGYHIVDHSSDGYVSVTGNSRMLLSGTTYMGRNNTQSGCTMTVVSKARTTSGYSVFTNRGGTNPNQMNWMWRYPTDAIFLHGSSSYNNPNYFTSTTGTPIVASIRTYYDNGVKQQLNDWTNSGSYSGNFQYGTEYNGTSALFCDYATVNNEFWQGDFYWIYMSQTTLTDEQIQQVINYNEGSGGTPTYPIYYDEIQNPPNNISFSSMTEAESYECPWVGMKATIDGVSYTFSGDSQSGYEWVQNTSRLPSGYTEVEYIESPTTSEYPYIDTSFKPNQNTRVIADLQYTQTNTHPRAFGCGMWNSVGYIFNAENGIGASNASWKWKFGANSNNWLTTNIQTDFNRHTVEINNGNLYLDNTLVGSTTVTTFQLSDNIGLFGFIYNGQLGGTSAGEYMTGKFYSFKIYDNGTLVRDFVPCTRDSDSKVGMYDIVNDVFYTSPNSYNFTAGNQV